VRHKCDKKGKTDKITTKSKKERRVKEKKRKREKSFFQINLLLIFKNEERILF
jgi:hypothetical protein